MCMRQCIKQFYRYNAGLQHTVCASMCRIIEIIAFSFKVRYNVLDKKQRKEPGFPGYIDESYFMFCQIAFPVCHGILFWY